MHVYMYMYIKCTDDTPADVVDEDVADGVGQLALVQQLDLCGGVAWIERGGELARTARDHFPKESHTRTIVWWNACLLTHRVDTEGGEGGERTAEARPGHELQARVQAGADAEGPEHEAACDVDCVCIRLVSRWIVELGCVYVRMYVCGYTTYLRGWPRAPCGTCRNCGRVCTCV